MGSVPVNLLELNKEEFKKFLDSFDHVFSDCDGVIWSGKVYPRVGEFFRLLKKHGKTINFVSNNSLRTKENYEEKFQEADIENGFENLVIPSVAISEYLKSINFNQTVFSVSCSETTRMLRSYGFKCKEGPEVSVEYYDNYDQYIENDEEIGAVVMDSDVKINLPKIHKAITYLKRPEVHFLAGASDTTFRLKQTAVLGTGIFTEIVAKEANREPLWLGKPGKHFGEFAMKKAGVTNPSRVLFIGDMLKQDIGLGKAVGFKTLLVLTHETKESTLAEETFRPDFYIDLLGSLVPVLEEI